MSHPGVPGQSSPHVNRSSFSGSRPTEIVSLAYQAAGMPSPSGRQMFSVATPPDSPSQKLLDSSDPEHTQYASRRFGDLDSSWTEEKETDIRDHGDKGWVPVPLRTWFWVPFITFMVLLAIGLEVALYLTNKNNGWSTSTDAFTNPSSFMHFVYTLPPVFVAMIIVALWAWTDIEIKKMQPYIDLVHGDAPPQKSLLLDYTRTNNFVVWVSAFWNRHYMVGLATLVALLALVFQPLGAAMFEVRDTWWGVPSVNTTTSDAISLNLGPTFQDLTAFLSAAGYASSSVLYNLSNPRFVYGAYTVGQFNIPSTVGGNGTVTANTTAIKTDPNCQLMATQSTRIGNEGWNNSATFNNCTFSYSVYKTTAHLFGTNVINNCNITDTPEFFLPVVLWFFTYDSTPPQGSATFCNPSISLWEVTVTLDIVTGSLTSVKEIKPFDSSTSPFSSLSANVTGPPMNGRAYNGIRFNITDPDEFVIARSNATDLQLPASVFQAAQQADGGLANAFATNSFVGMATKIYGIYLKLIARTVYFLPTQEPLSVEVMSFQKRLWLNDIAVHIEVAALLIVAVVGTIVHLIHRQSRQQLHFRHEPGTIASAVSIGADTNLAHLLNGRQEQSDLVRALSNKKFRINPRTMKIIMEGEKGYDQAFSPNRQSFFGKRFSSFGRTPLSSA